MPLRFSVTDYRKQRNRKSRLQKQKEAKTRGLKTNSSHFMEMKTYLERDTHCPKKQGKQDKIGESTLCAGFLSIPKSATLVCTSAAVPAWQQKVFKNEMSFRPQAQFLGQNVPTKADLTQKPQTSFYT